MEIAGTVQNGIVVLETASPWPDGTRVKVTSHGPSPVAPESIPTIQERYKDIIGIAPELPADMAENHDHYVHGTPKK